LLIVEGHVSSIREFLAFQDILISGSRDTLVKKWDINSGELLQTIKTGGYVSSMFLHDGILFCGIYSSSFTKFDVITGLFIENVKGFTLDLLMCRIFFFRQLFGGYG
jgi:WD40 repeat protein